MALIGQGVRKLEDVIIGAIFLKTDAGRDCEREIEGKIGYSKIKNTMVVC